MRVQVLASVQVAPRAKHLNLPSWIGVVAETALQMIVHHAHCLHEGIANCCADELETL